MGNGLWIKSIAAVLCFCGVVAGQAAQVIYVDGAAVGADDGSSWADAYVYLQDALAEAAVAAPPIEIWVAQGTYKPDQGAGITPRDPNAAFQLLNGVTLKGGYAGVAGINPDVRDMDTYPTMLSGTLGSLDDLPIGCSNQVVIAKQTDATAVIDGFIIRNWCHDGMHIDAGSPAIRNCVFWDSRSCVDIDRGSPSFMDCRFSEYENYAIFAMDSNCTLARCAFERQGRFPFVFVWLAAIRSYGGNLSLTDCTFTKHGGPCIDVSGSLELVCCSFVGIATKSSDVIRCFGILTASDCVFRDNTSEVVSVSGNAEFVGCRFVGNSGTAVKASGDALRATRCVFSGNAHSGIGGGAAIWCIARYMELSHCVFRGNFAPEGRAGAIDSGAQLARISHCTFAGNRGEPSTMDIGAHVEMTQCIVRDGPNPFATWPPDVAPPMIVTYSNVEGGWVGEGNIDVDPCFVDPGYWDANDTPDDPTDDVWVAGDYHLKSQAGHWDVESEGWVFDDVTSPCIDAGDPNGPINAEPFPNGGYANLGAYGGTAEASRSYFGEPLCTTQIAGDINGDCKVDDFDMDILLSHWQMEDVGRINVPPTITIVSPQDGAEFSRPEPIVLEFETSDPDGRVIYLSYDLEHDLDGLTYSTGSGTGAPANSLVREYPWSQIPYDGLYVLRARAVDDRGAVTVAPEITITLHP
ncbi:MAG: hypothetical protein JW741_21445 [Sedimentisphaerales bacterium]|nr:hypothetical protein [Sedimentisphaerales bacterium]